MGLSEQTLEWLDWYNGLTEEEQAAVDYIPLDLADNFSVKVEEAEPDSAEFGK